MKKENRNIKIQVRIAPSEKDMLEKLGEFDKKFSISKLVRNSIHQEYNRHQTVKA